MKSTSRRSFLKQLSFTTLGLLPAMAEAFVRHKSKIKVGAHLWVYASNYPPNWDCTPVIEEVFNDLKYAGIDCLEVMHTNLLHKHAVDQLGLLIDRYKLPIIGSSYSADMWNKENHQQILEETHMLFERLQQLKGKTFGISVGDAKHVKTSDELDAQAIVLQNIRATGEAHGITSNLHNHTYEVTNSMHDLKGTLQRIPDFPLGPDLNWLIRAGVNPVNFIDQYKDQIVYLHLRDQYNNGEWSEALGEGDTDFEAIRSALGNVDFKGIATIELAFPQNFKLTRPLRDTWKISCDFVKGTMNW